MTLEHSAGNRRKRRRTMKDIFEEVGSKDMNSHDLQSPASSLETESSSMGKSGESTGSTVNLKMGPCLGLFDLDCLLDDFDDFDQDCRGDLDLYPPETPAVDEAPKDRDSMTRQHTSDPLPSIQELVGLTPLDANGPDMTLQELTTLCGGNPGGNPPLAQPAQFLPLNAPFPAVAQPGPSVTPWQQGINHYPQTQDIWDHPFPMQWHAPFLPPSAFSNSDFGPVPAGAFSQDAMQRDLNSILDAASGLQDLDEDVRTDRLSLSQDLDAQPRIPPFPSTSESAQPTGGSNKTSALASTSDGRLQHAPSIATRSSRQAGGGEQAAALEPPATARRRGRPRLYDTSVPTDRSSREQSGQEDVAQEPFRKKRGAKPKYKYKTEAEAVAQRRDRNRRTAIESYYKRKDRDNSLAEQIEELKRENKALHKLEDVVETSSLHRGMIRQLLEETKSGCQTLEILKLNTSLH